MASLGQLVIELAANTARLQSDLGKAVTIAERGAAKMQGAFKALGGGLIATFFINTARNAIKMGDDLQKAATKAGLGGKQISELAYAAKMADVDLAALSTSIKKMQVNLSEAASGAKAPNEALKALGLKIENIKNLKADQQFEAIADQISKLKDPADRARAATELFGKAGADLLPMFEQGAAGIQKAREQAKLLGLSFEDAALKKMSEADDAIKRLDASWQGFAFTLTSKVAGPLASIMDTLSGVDTRSQKQKFDAEIESRTNPYSRRARTAGMTPEQRRAFDAETEQMRVRRQTLVDSSHNLGGRGRSTLPTGFLPEPDKDPAKKAADRGIDEFDRMIAGQRDAMRDLSADLDDEFHKDNERWVKRTDASRQYLEDTARGYKLLYEQIEEEAKQLSEPAKIFRDAFLNAFDNMVNTGKFAWDELLKYLVAEFTRRGISKLFDSMFAGGPGGGGSASGFFGWFGGLFGGTRDSGGRGSAGKVYEIGKRAQPELFIPDGPGTFVPAGARGGGTITVAPVIHIDARGATVDSVKLLPAMARQISESTEARIVERLRRHYYQI